MLWGVSERLGLGVEWDGSGSATAARRVPCAHKAVMKKGTNGGREGQDVATPRVRVDVHADGQRSN